MLFCVQCAVDSEEPESKGLNQSDLRTFCSDVLGQWDILGKVGQRHGKDSVKVRWEHDPFSIIFKKLCITCIHDVYVGSVLWCTCGNQWTP